MLLSPLAVHFVDLAKTHCAYRQEARQTIFVIRKTGSVLGHSHRLDTGKSANPRRNHARTFTTSGIRRRHRPRRSRRAARPSSRLSSLSHEKLGRSSQLGGIATSPSSRRISAEIMHSTPAPRNMLMDALVAHFTNAGSASIGGKILT